MPRLTNSYAQKVNLSLKLCRIKDFFQHVCIITSFTFLPRIVKEICRDYLRHGNFSPPLPSSLGYLSFLPVNLRQQVCKRRGERNTNKYGETAVGGILPPRPLSFSSSPSKPSPERWCVTGTEIFWVFFSFKSFPFFVHKSRFEYVTNLVREGEELAT